MGLYSKQEPVAVSYGIGDKDHDSEGRSITAEYKNYYVVTACEFWGCGGVEWSGVEWSGVEWVLVVF